MLRSVIYFNFRNRAVSGLSPENVAKGRGPGARLRIVCFSFLRTGVSRRDSGCLLSGRRSGGAAASACPCHSWYRQAAWPQGISLRCCLHTRLSVKALAQRARTHSGGLHNLALRHTQHAQRVLQPRAD